MHLDTNWTENVTLKRAIHKRNFSEDKRIKTFYSKESTIQYVTGMEKYRLKRSKCTWLRGFSGVRLHCKGLQYFSRLFSEVL